MSLIELLIIAVKCLVVFTAALLGVPFMVWFERKVVAHMQMRLGPMYVGPHGVLQPFADAIKLMFKEDFLPPQANKVVYYLAPVLGMTTAVLAFSVIPFGPQTNLFGLLKEPIPLQVTDLNIGLLIIFSATAMGVYGIVLAGWSSNSKYPLLGALRSTAQMASYELSLGLSTVSILMLAGSLSLNEIVNAQAGLYWGFIPRWFVFQSPTGFAAFLLYFICGVAETNRAPFDLPEAETELVAGFHTEYSSMKFAMFFMAEYVNMIAVSAIATTLFLGGWHGWGAGGDTSYGWVIGLGWFVAKVISLLFVYVWLRATLPRLRYDQLMAFGWKFLFPASLVTILATALWISRQVS
ncbi:MAG: NADH-quinone oxidoreductase subunit NuoH [Acidobacteria bacterium]|nr:NADH-quinone oxidoreductase subunit NuoH [Acidobacteriota bacterium]